MIIGRPSAFAIEYAAADSKCCESPPREYLLFSLRYWINNKPIGDMSASCYLGDLVQDLSQIVRDNDTRDGHELCLMKTEDQFLKIYEGIYNDLEPTVLDMPAKYNILPRLPPFGEWFVFAIKCANRAILLYSKYPFALIEKHVLYEHELNGVLRITFNNITNVYGDFGIGPN